MSEPHPDPTVDRWAFPRSSRGVRPAGSFREPVPGRFGRKPAGRPLPKPTLRAVAGPLLAILLFALAVNLLVEEAREVTWEQFVAGWRGIPTLYLLIAGCLVALNYGLFVAYDLLGLRYICRSLPLRRVVLVSFLGYSLGNNLGTILAATPIRFRYYGQWGIPARQIIALVSIMGLTFWSGVWFLGGVVLTLVPVELPAELPLPLGSQALGVALAVLWVAYAVVCVVWRRPWPIGALHLRPPRPGLMTLQTTVAALDLLLSAITLYLVLPAQAVVPFQLVLAAYLIGIAVSMITQVPGGLGVLEVILLKLLKGSVGESVLASVLVFRLFFYVIPLLCGMVAMVAHEIYGGAVEARRVRRWIEVEAARDREGRPRVKRLRPPP